MCQCTFLTTKDNQFVYTVYRLSPSMTCRFGNVLPIYMYISKNVIGWYYKKQHKDLRSGVDSISNNLFGFFQSHFFHL